MQYVIFKGPVSNKIRIRPVECTSSKLKIARVFREKESNKLIFKPSFYDHVFYNCLPKDLKCL